MTDSKTYISVPLLDDVDEALDHSQSQYTSVKRSGHRLWLRSSFLLASHLFIFCLTAGLLFLARTEHSRSLQSCAQKTSFYSPGLESVKYETVRFAGLQDPHSVFRGEPRPELDAAWDSVTWQVPEIPVSEDVVRQAGISLDHRSMVRFPAENGGGFYADLEWKHQLHCLNSLRKVTFMEYYQDREDEWPLRVPKAELQNHLAHCIDILRQYVMCNADMGLIFSYWIEDHEHHHVDFSTEHKCRKFDNALDWATENGFLVEQAKLVRHPGAVNLTTHPENLTRGSTSFKDRMLWYGS